MLSNSYLLREVHLNSVPMVLNILFVREKFFDSVQSDSEDCEREVGDCLVRVAVVFVVSLHQRLKDSI